LIVVFLIATFVLPVTRAAMLLAPALVASLDSSARSRSSTPVTPLTSNAGCPSAGITCDFTALGS
jgi:hypothetical protein